MYSNYLYTELADWWPLLSDPADYAEEAGIYRDAFLSHCHPAPTTMLELGSGGGNNASHLKRSFKLTLVDRSPGMLAVSRKLNPECTHIQGDMRAVRLGREFDAVFIHDAIAYMSTRADLRQALATAYVHCRFGGAALFVPDYTVENFKPYTDHGGHDLGGRGLRYLGWVIDHDPNDEMYSSYMIYLMREGSTLRQSPVDEHRLGIFPEQVWLNLIRETGFEPLKLPYDHSDFEKGTHFMFMGLKKL